MRFLMAVLISVGTLALVIGPAKAQYANGKRAENEPQPQTQKEIAELQARVRKAAAEFAALWATDMPPWPHVTAVEGSVTQLYAGKGMPKAMGVVPGDPRNGGVGISLTKETKAYYSDTKPAKLSDLMVGQLVRVGVRMVGPTQTFEADVVFIDKSAREIVGAKDAAKVAKETNFATEYLVLYRWTGWSGYAEDRVWFTVKETKDGPLVEIHLVRPKQKAGMAKVVEQPESRLYVIAKNARVSGSPLMGEGTKITNAEELAKAFPVGFLPAQEKKANNKTHIVGVWELTKADDGGPPVGTTMEFTKDGKLRMMGKADGKEFVFGGTYVVEGNKFTGILKTPNREEKGTATIKKLTDTELVTEDENGRVLEFKRKKRAAPQASQRRTTDPGTAMDLEPRTIETIRLPEGNREKIDSYSRNVEVETWFNGCRPWR